MGFFNRSRHNSEANTNAAMPYPAETGVNAVMLHSLETASAPTNFADQVANAAAATEQVNAAAARQARQERKLIGAFLHGEHDMDKDDVEISDSERELFYDAMTDGRITTEAKKNLISQIRTPMQAPNNLENVFASVSSKHEQRILAYMSAAGFENWQQLDSSALTRTLNTYPTPYDFNPVAESFLDAIRQNNSPEKYQQYVDAMDSFKHKFYGKRLEYYDALEALQHQADQHAAERSSRTEVLAVYHPETVQSQPETKQQKEAIMLRGLEQAEISRIMEQSKIDGDGFIYQNQEYHLTPNALEQYGLEPTYCLELKGANINLSKPFQIGSRTAVMAYVATEKGTKVCSYYRSNSQGIWRYLPEYVQGNDNELVDYYGKGYDEESLNLPNDTQTALEMITNLPERVELNDVAAAFALAGTAKRYASRDEYLQAQASHTLRGEFYQETPSNPSISLGRLSYTKVAPETLDITGGVAPDFSTLVDSYTTKTGLYGDISVETVDSQDGKLEYTFNRDEQGRAWLSHIEIADAPIGSTGLRTAWAASGDFGTPLYEYQQMSSGYGDASDRRGSYVNMWQNYLSRMPLIQKYLSSHQKS